jgi:Flp pilus assembly secretin CpaC
MAASIVRGRRGRLRRFASAAAIVAAFAWSAPAGADPLTVVLDQAQVVKLPDQVATVVVGNPTVADVSVQPGGVLVVTGRGYGATNVLVLDRGGRLLMEKAVQVVGPTDNMVVVYRGVDRESWSCTPRCERRLLIGDAQPHFDLVTGQIAVRNSLGQTGAPPPKN